jgi:hypothetical protein
MEHRAKKKPSSRHKTAVKTAEGVQPAGQGSTGLRPQRHGGGLLPGGLPGNKGGTGRPPSQIRAALRASYDARMGFLDDVIDGKVQQTVQYPVLELARHVECKKCKTPLQAVDASILDSITVRVSASTKDRIAAVEHQAKYSLGQLKEISVENVREKLERQVELLRNRFSGEVLNTLLREMREIWNS